MTDLGMDHAPQLLAASPQAALERLRLILFAIKISYIKA